jgi:VanZ family protein
MNKIKDFFKSRWTYKITENELLLMEGATVATTMGLSLLLLGIMNNISIPYTLGRVNDMVASTVVFVIGLVLVVLVAYKIYKKQEKI